MIVLVGCNAVSSLMKKEQGAGSKNVQSASRREVCAAFLKLYSDDAFVCLPILSSD